MLRLRAKYAPRQTRAGFGDHYIPLIRIYEERGLEYVQHVEYLDDDGKLMFVRLLNAWCRRINRRHHPLATELNDLLTYWLTGNDLGQITQRALDGFYRVAHHDDPSPAALAASYALMVESRRQQRRPVQFGIDAVLCLRAGFGVPYGPRVFSEQLAKFSKDIPLQIGRAHV